MYNHNHHYYQYVQLDVAKYQSVENYEFKIGTNTYGKIHDITKISTDLFLIFTDKGLYRWNVKTNSIELIYNGSGLDLLK